MAQHDRPRLLARRLQHGYIELDPDDPDLDPKITRALISEPEPVSDDELDRRAFARRATRERQLMLARDRMLAELDALVADASVAERRRLRNVRRAVQSL